MQPFERSKVEYNTFKQIKNDKSSTGNRYVITQKWLDMWTNFIESMNHDDKK